MIKAPRIIHLKARQQSGSNFYSEQGHCWISRMVNGLSSSSLCRYCLYSSHFQTPHTNFDATRFACAGDGPPVHQGHHGWLHWLDKPLTEGGRPNFDLFPDVTEYSEEELYPVPGLAFPSSNHQYNSPGKPAKLFSSRNPKTVQRHFHWMAQHGIDGAFLQRFASQCEVDGNTTGSTADLMRLRDEVLDRVREAAERDHRVWAIMYV